MKITNLSAFLNSKNRSLPSSYLDLTCIDSKNDIRVQPVADHASACGIEAVALEYPQAETGGWLARYCCSYTATGFNLGGNCNKKQEKSYSI